MATIRKSPGFTLIELLVVIAIMMTLMAILLPAIQKVREAAQRMTCGNNLKQIGVALHNHENNLDSYPTVETYPLGGTGDAFSIQARLLPFLEQTNLHGIIDFSQPYSKQPLVTARQIPVYICPSEPKAVERIDGTVTHFPLNYGANMGTWMVYNPQTGKGGDGAFAPNRRFRAKHFIDGHSNTLAFAEIKAYTPYLRDGGAPNSLGDIAPTDPAIISGFGGSFKTDSGHTEWVDGRVHQSGFTTTFAPQTVVPHAVGGVTYDIDFNSSREGKTKDKLTFAAVTARSHHLGGVNILLMDGGVRTAGKDIPLDQWRDLGTREGREPGVLLE